VEPDSVVGFESTKASQPLARGSQRSHVPMVTLLLCGACAVLFVAISARGTQPSWESLAAWGYLPAGRVWDGAYWSLVSSAFIHVALWHVAFNVYWLWVLGGPGERVIGSMSYLGFVLAASFVSSSVQLGVSGRTGHGASGVVYGLFGLIWASRKSVPEFARALGGNTALLFWGWLLGCILATRAGIANVGNGAHVGGLLFGLVVARLLILTTVRRAVALGGAALLVAVSFVPLVWSPWSPTWVGYRAYKAHIAGDYDAAIAGYRRSIALGGDRVWALENLAIAYRSAGAAKEYEATVGELRAADAAAAAKVEAYVGESRDDTQEKLQ